MPTDIQAPPALAEESPHERIRFRVQQIVLAFIAIAVTVWLWRIHPILGLVAAFLAKHVLVAILASGLTYPAIREERKQE